MQSLTNEKREVRVFVSSTFIDLKEERDYIIRRTFPRLAEYCRKRGILFTGVDLRWGITEEQSREGRTIRLCLDEIKKCRPFFVNILGQRYGWIPTSEDLIKDNVLRENYKELIDRSLNDSISITEMEIIEGVFSRGSDVKAFFFIGDEGYYDKKNAQLNIESEDENKKNRLRKLKDTIRSSGFPVFESFKGKEELGEEVFNALKKAIDEKYPVYDELDESQKRHLQHASYALSRRDYYLESKDIFKTITDHVQNTGSPLLIWGESGTGKSALLANWAAYYRQNFPNIKVIEHYIGAESHSESDIISHILMELKEYDNLKESTKRDNNALKIKLVEVLRSIKSKIVLVIDGINLLEETEKDLGWIFGDVTKNAVFILSTTEESYYKSASGKGWYTFRLQSLNKMQIRTIISEYLRRHGKELDIRLIDKIIENKIYYEKFNMIEKFLLKADYCQYAGHLGNPMFLKIFIDELILNATNEDISQKIDEYLDVLNIEELIYKVFDRLEEDFGEKTTDFLLSHIYVSRNGLSEQELRLLGEMQGISYINIIECLNNLSYYLISKGDLLDFSHDFIRNAVYKKYIENEKKEFEIRRNVINCFKTFDFPDRIIDEVPYHLYILDDKNGLRDFFSDKAVFTELCRRYPYTLFKYIRKLMDEELTFVEDFLNSTGADEELKETFAEFLIKNRHFNSAEKLYKITLNTKVVQLGENHKDLSPTVKGIFKTLLLQEKYEEAIRYADYDRKISSTNYGIDSLEAANSINNYALALLNQKRVNESIEQFQKSFDIKKKYYSYDSMELLTAEEKIYMAMGFDTKNDYRKDKTIKKRRFLDDYSNDLRVIKLKELLEAKKKISGEFSSEVGKSYLWLGDFFKAQKEEFYAEKHYNMALSCFKKTFGEGHIIISDIYLKLKKYKEAWIIKLVNLGLKHPETIKAMELYQNSLDYKSDWKEAMIEKFLALIKYKSSLPELEKLDDLLEKPKITKKVNRQIGYKYFLPIHTIFFFIFLYSASMVLPLSWFPAAGIVFYILLLGLGYINGRNKNYFSLFDMSLFAFCPIILEYLITEKSNVLLRMFSYITIVEWFQNFNFNAVIWLTKNFINVDAELLLKLITNSRSLLSVGITRYLMFSVMFLLALTDLKFESLKRNLAKKMLYGGQ